MSVLRFCLDRHVLAMLGLAALGIAVLAPSALAAVLPLLLLAACPLSMVAMAVLMNRGAAPPAPPSTIESMRTELADIAARQHELEGELAAADTQGAR